MGSFQQETGLVEDIELENLKGEYHCLEEKITQLMEELLLELEKKDSKEVLNCEVKEDIKNITNQIFDLSISKEEINERA